MSKGFFVKDGKAAYYGTRADKPQLEANHDWVPSDDPQAPTLRDAMDAEPVRPPQPNLQDLIDELGLADTGLSDRLQVRANARK